MSQLQTINVFIYNATEYKEFKDYYSDHRVLKIQHGNIFNAHADCLITAGQSFGMMDGGIDGHVNYFFDRIQGRVQQAILQEWQGELPVGVSIILPTPENKNFKHLCYAPTMRLPMCVYGTINAYLAMRGALIAAAKYPSIKTIAVPLLCHGVGRMPCLEILKQIEHAYDTFTNPTPRNWKAIMNDSIVLDQEPSM